MCAERGHASRARRTGLRGPWLLLLAVLLPAAVRSEPGDGYLDVSLLLFDTSASASPAAADDIPAVRQAEAIWFPALLRQQLESSGRWGALRLLPAQEAGFELLVSGRVLESGGDWLELEIEAVDSSGRQWLRRRYREPAREGVSLLGDQAADPFQALYQQVAADLEAGLDSLAAEDVARLETLATLRYAANLAPERFAAYLLEEDAGFRYSRLPPQDDPLWRRVIEIRGHEFLLIDVLDEQYRRYIQHIAPTYALWRRYRREQRDSVQAYQARQAGDDDGFRPGSYRALRESYERFRWMKLQEEYLDELREGFSNEIRPAELRLEDRVYRLSGTQEEQYREWRAILRELYLLDTGE